MTVLGSIALLLLFGVVMFGLAVMFLRSNPGSEDDWDDDLPDDDAEYE